MPAPSLRECIAERSSQMPLKSPELVLLTDFPRFTSLNLFLRACWWEYLAELATLEW
jgi:hypothetical protein